MNNDGNPARRDPGSNPGTLVPGMKGKNGSVLRQWVNGRLRLGATRAASRCTCDDVIRR